MDKGNSFANGPQDPCTWAGGYQAPEPVTGLRLAEPAPGSTELR
jgi:hypothetical protein